jgi:hypothetical protein
MPDDLQGPPNRQFLFYDTEDGVTQVQMLIDGNTVWMSKKATAELFETSVANVNMHTGITCDDSEVDPDSVIEEYLISAGDRKQYRTKHYSLQMLLAVSAGGEYE